MATCQTLVGEVKVLSDWVHHLPRGPVHQSGNKKNDGKKGKLQNSNSGLKIEKQNKDTSIK